MIKTVYHGSDHIIINPELNKGKTNNDFGRGFYCTESIALAGEWACKKASDGFANCYKLDMDGLSVCNLNSNEYHILNWLALLTKHRSYWQKQSIAEQAKAFLQERYLPDISTYDIIVGYRADDSYFSFAQDFIMGTISLQKLAQAMKLGNLGEQIVLKSPKAFEQISYESNTFCSASEFYTKKTKRDSDARITYASSKKGDTTDGIYIIDILRGRVTEDELRLQ